MWKKYDKVNLKSEYYKSKKTPEKELNKSHHQESRQ